MTLFLFMGVKRLVDYYLQKTSCKKYTFVCMCESHLPIKKKGRSIFYLLLSFYEITKGLSLSFSLSPALPPVMSLYGFLFIEGYFIAVLL